MIYIFNFFLPLFSFLSLFFFGYFLGLQGSILFSKLFSFLFILSSYYIFLCFLSNQKSVYLYFFDWISSGYLNIQWSFTYDSLSIFMLFLISTIFIIIVFYSFFYMLKDPYLLKFLSYLFLFIFFMLILITSIDFSTLLLGWEGVGICSFLLIGFWSNRLSAAKASLKAIIFNRFGDLGFVIGTSLIFFYVHSLNFFVIYSFLPYFKFYFFFYPIYLLDFILFFFFLAVIGKSSQIGLHVWLLDAMEGPTPVSALIHAATMVTAGIFLLLRLSFLFEFSIYIKIIICVFACFTAFFSSFSAIFQNDLKSIIAYSTCSQLGYMVLIISLSNYYIALFHLINHGFFKALLFLISGVLIHKFLDEQDIRKYGGISNVFPLSFSYFLIGSFSLCGLPFLSGFFSKELIINFFYIMPLSFTNFLYIVLILSLLFTFLYSFRTLYLVFLEKPNGFKSTYSITRESFTISMHFSFFVLAFYSIFSGFFFSDVFSGIGSNFFFDSIFNFDIYHSYLLFLNFYFLQNYNLWFTLKNLPLFFLILALSIYHFIYEVFPLFEYFKFYYIFYHYFSFSFFFNYIYINFFLSFFFRLCWFFFLFDRSFLEFFLIKIFENFSFSFFINLEKLHIHNFYLIYFYLILYFFLYIFILFFYIF